MAAKVRSPGISPAEIKPDARVVEPLPPVSRLESRAAGDWLDRHGAAVLAVVAIIITILMAVGNSSLVADIARNAAELELARAELAGLKAERAGPVAPSPEAQRLGAEVARHEKDVLRIFGILGKPRELRQ